VDQLQGHTTASLAWCPGGAAPSSASVRLPPSLLFKHNKTRHLTSTVLLITALPQCLGWAFKHAEELKLAQFDIWATRPLCVG